MARFKFALPEGPPVYECELDVRISDLNYGAHLGNDRVLSLCHEARVKWLSSLDMKEVDHSGLGLIMADAMIMYQGEGFLGDTLTFTLKLGEITERAFDLYYQITRKADNQAIARIKNAMIFFNYNERKISRASGETLSKLQTQWRSSAL